MRRKNDDQETVKWARTDVNVGKTGCGGNMEGEARCDIAGIQDCMGIQADVRQEMTSRHEGIEAVEDDEEEEERSEHCMSLFYLQMRLLLLVHLVEMNQRLSRRHREEAQQSDFNLPSTPRDFMAFNHALCIFLHMSC
jgi:hypothetical protein